MTRVSDLGGEGRPRVRNAIVRPPSASMGEGLTTRALGFPDLETARAQHRAYTEALEREGLRVRRLPSAPSFPDSQFVEDTAVLHGGVAILTRPGAQPRRAEVELIRPVLEREMEVRELGPDPDATLDGGDVLIAGRHAMIGISKRTNRAGGRLLAERLREVDPGLDVRLVPFDGPLHLKSGLTALRPDVYVMDPALRLRAELPAPVRTLPATEGYAANVLPINDALFVLAGSPTIVELGRAHAERAVPLDLSEFRKMDGSLTCLSLLW
ncbi:MAG: dimethylarginine dimethylaminohydrolase family protein [Thermoplasmata archaeon]